MKNYLTLDSIDVSKKIVGIRVDINSAIIDSKVQKSARIVEACKSIKELIDKNAKVVILAHQGRKGKDDFTSLKLHQEIMEDELGVNITFQSKISSKAVNENLKKSNIILVENLREQDYEQKPQFLKNGSLKVNEIIKIIELCDYYILDAFSISHRAHSSVIGSSKIPQVAGRLLQRELKPLSILDNVPHPRVYVMGGAKPDDLLPLIKQGLESKSVDTILLSGVIGEVALHSQGVDLGKKWKWIKEHEFNNVEKELKQLIKKYSKQFILPKDVAIIDDKGKRVEILVSKIKLKKNQDLIKKYIIQDIGSLSVKEFMNVISKSKSCYLKGPQGNFEIKGGDVSTYSLFKEIVKSKTFSFMGGGHSVTAAEKSKTKKKFSYVSLAGGALVQYLMGKQLPGIKVLEDSYIKFKEKLDNPLDVVVVGSNVVDTFVNSPVDINAEVLGSKIKVDHDFTTRVGGGGVNVSASISKLDGKVGLITRLSEQSISQIMNASQEHHFSILSPKIHDEEAAKSILIQVPGKDRVIFTYRGQNQKLSKTDIPKELPISNFYFSGLTHTAFKTQMQLMKRIKKEQPHSMIIYNPSLYAINEHHEEIVDKLKYVDVLIFNDEEAQKLTHEIGIRNNLVLLTTLGPKVIVITQGSKGAYAIDSSTCKIHHEKSHAIKPIVDTTGAGDCFAATFTYFISKRFSVQDCLKMSSINAGHLISKEGSLVGALDLNELKSKFYLMKK